MKNLIDQKVLITTQGWFYGPDGKQYKAIWGTLKAVHEAGKSLGFIPNRSHANWFIEVGEMIIMGCQVMYLIRCDNKPETGFVGDYSVKENGLLEYERPGHILILNE
jgi:hypothetical protein